MLITAAACPFCNHPFTHRVHFPGGYVTDAIQCSKCGSVGPGAPDRQTALRFWNNTTHPRMTGQTQYAIGEIAANQDADIFPIGKMRED